MCGMPVISVDTTKIRNQVEFWTDAKHERDGHLELISEEQMGSKDYAGLYTRHLHLEPIALAVARRVNCGSRVLPST